MSFPTSSSQFSLPWQGVSSAISHDLLVGMPRVDRFMSKDFSLIGFDDINDHHVTDYASCRQLVAEYFTIVAENRLPAFVPSFMGIYFSMFLQKKND